MQRRLAIIVAALVFIALQSTHAPTRPRNQPRSSTQALNLAWVLIAGFLVMFMQVGFAMFETGFTRAKNAVNTMAMNLIIYPVGLLGFWLTGYGLMMGGVSQWPRWGREPHGASRALDHDRRA